jgi:hypothetical protein
MEKAEATNRNRLKVRPEAPGLIKKLKRLGIAYLVEVTRP